MFRMVVQEGILSIFFTIIAFIGHFSVCNVAALQWASFDRLAVNQERFSSPYRTLTKASNLQCSVVCAVEEECYGFNHHAVFKSCELIDSSRLQQERLVTAENVWTVFTKDTCKDGWVNFIGQCYLFEDTNTNRLNWEDAKTSCESENATLAVIETAEENQFVKDFITTLTQNRDMYWKGFWIAGLEVGGEGNWHWYPDNSEIQYRDFQPGHINSSTLENCLIMWSRFYFKWADHFCNEAQYYVCEKSGVF